MCCGIQKKSREESSGSGSGVEILVNEPYTDGPGGAGQYTQKIYHIGSHLPGTSLLHEPLPVCVRGLLSLEVYLRLSLELFLDSFFPVLVLVLVLVSVNNFPASNSH